MTIRDQIASLKQYRPLMRSMLKPIRDNISREDMEELQSSCMFAIIRAVESYDARDERGATEMTLVRAYITGEIRNFIRHLSCNRTIFESGTISMTTPVDNGEAWLPMEDSLAAPDSDPTDAMMLNAAIASIHDPRRRDIVSRVAEGETMRSIGRDYGVGRKRIFQIKEEGIKEMSGNMGRKKP